MEYRTLGKTKLRCSVLGLGTGKLTSVSSRLSRKQAVNLIRAAADQGINLIDAADIYGQGDSEIIVGEALRGRRADFILASKIGYRFNRGGGLLRAVKPIIKPILRPFKRARSLVAAARQQAQTANILQQDFSPEYLSRALDASLRRLGTDYLDVLYLHDVPLGIMRSSSVLEALNQFERAGKIRCIGFSTGEDEVIEAAADQPGNFVVQTAVHPWRSSNQWASMSALSAKGIGVIAHNIFGSGAFLNDEAEPNRWERLVETGRRHGMNPKQILIAFASNQPSVCSVLTGTTDPDHLKENVVGIMSARSISLGELQA